MRGKNTASDYSNFQLLLENQESSITMKDYIVTNHLHNLLLGY